jgi:hypothetical protein
LWLISKASGCVLGWYSLCRGLMADPIALIQSQLFAPIVIGALITRKTRNNSTVCYPNFVRDLSATFRDFSAVNLQLNIGNGLKTNDSNSGI